MNSKTTMLLILFALTFLIPNTSAQSFKFVTPHSTITAGLNAEIIFDFPIVNLSNQTITVYILRRAQTIPESWSGSMCFGSTCFSPTFDSVATTSDFNSNPIAPGDTVDFSYHFFADNIPASATVKLVAKNSRDISDSVAVTLIGITQPVSVKDPSAVIGYKLEQNYPNPFNPSTLIRYSVENTSDVTITISNILGQKVFETSAFNQTPGSYALPFNAKGLSSGMYTYTIKAVSENQVFTDTKKMLLSK